MSNYFSTYQNAAGVPVTPVGTISSTDVQSALAELDTDIQKQPATSEVQGTTSTLATVSGTPAIITGATFTPGAGKFQVIISGDVSASAAMIVTFTLFNNAVAVTGAVRRCQPVFASGAGLGAGTSSIVVALALNKQVTMVAAQNLDLRWTISAAGTATLTNLTFDIVKTGN